jgi:phage major head subunit gpT-like protein
MSDILATGLGTSPFFSQASLRFQNAYAAAQGEVWHPKVATIETSKGRSNTYAWSTRLPQMNLFKKERIVQSIGTFAQVVENATYESTLEVSRDDVDDDMFGVFASGINDRARVAAKWPDTLILAAMRTGESVLSWDGQNFFSTAHPVDYLNPASGYGTQQNYWAAGMGLSFDNFSTVWQNMVGFKGDDNLPLGIIPNLLLVPPALRATAHMICQAENAAPQSLGGVTQVGANTNPWRGVVDYLVLPELQADPTAWYLIDTTKGVMPWVFQRRLEPEFAQQTDPNSPAVYQRNAYSFGVRVRGAAANTLWFLASKAKA